MDKRMGVMTVLLCLLAGCGGAVSPGPTGGQQTASTTPQSPAASAPGSASPGSHGATSPAVPDGFPLPGDATPLESADVPEWAVAGWAVDATPQEVFAFYEAALESDGYTIEASVPGGDAAIIRFTSPDGTQLQLDFNGHDPVRLALGSPHD